MKKEQVAARVSKLINLYISGTLFAVFLKASLFDTVGKVAVEVYNACMNSDNSIELSVEHLLQSVGLQVERIPESDTKTPDFYISDSRYSYLLEVKDRFPDLEKLKRRKEILESGEVHNTQEQPSHNRNISNGIMDVTKQLSAYKAKSTNFRLVWLSARTFATALKVISATKNHV